MSMNRWKGSYKSLLGILTASKTGHLQLRPHHNYEIILYLQGLYHHIQHKQKYVS